MLSTWQSRLAAKQNGISQLLVDNAISLAGDAIDVIRVTANLDFVQDVQSRIIEGIDVVNMVFPAMIDIPMKRFNNIVPLAASANAAQDIVKPFECYARVDQLIKQDDFLLRFYENPIGDEPWVLPLQVKDVLGTFGSRKIIWQKMNVTYIDTSMSETVYNFCLQMGVRRNVLGW